MIKLTMKIIIRIIAINNLEIMIVGVVDVVIVEIFGVTVIISFPFVIVFFVFFFSTVRLPSSFSLIISYKQFC